MTEKKTPKISIGITSMTVILCVLCLTVFSALSLSTAISERSLSEKRAEAAKKYYTAEAEATALLNDVLAAWQAGEGLQSHMEQGKMTVEDGKYHFMKTIDEGQALSVGFRLTDGLEIDSWKVVSTADWTPDDSLTVWDGEMSAEE